MYHGGPLKPHHYDHLNDGKYLHDFVGHQNSRVAMLTESNVLATRLYTTSSFKRFNIPLRSGVRPHPFRMCLYHLDDSLRKLRKVNSRSEAFSTPMTFYRYFSCMLTRRQFHAFLIWPSCIYYDKRYISSLLLEPY